MSSSKTSTSQKSDQLGQEGYLSNSVQIQNTGTLTYSPAFTPETFDLFGKIIGLASDSVDAATNSGQLALAAVQSNSERIAQPGESLTRDLMPLAMIAVVGVIVYVVWGKK